MLAFESGLPAHSKAGSYFLVSFAPSVGIGQYEILGTRHVFDLVPPRQAEQFAERLHAALRSSEQVEAGFRFEHLEELLAVCRKEYLKDKKDAYYAMLFTPRLARTVADRTLKFLNEPSLCRVPISRMVVSVLK